jgi:hypothetical protein
MDINKIIEISNDAENKSNKDLISARDILMEEFDKTKDLIINLTKHLEGIEEMYDKVNNEIKKRIIK